MVTLLRERFKAPEFAFIPSVRNGTGWARNARTADGLAMSLWPSRGLELHGFEIKVSRSDWFREKNDPQKAEDIAQFCDRWWLVTSDEAIAPLDEVPPTWGLLTVRRKKLVVVREPAKLEAKPLDRLFLAAILRRAAEYTVNTDEIRAAVEKEREEARAATEAAIASDRSFVKQENERLRASIAELEKVSGRALNSYSVHDIGYAIRVVLDGRFEEHRHELDALRHRARAIAEAADLALAPPTPGGKAA